MATPVEQILALPSLARVASQLRSLVRWSIRIECEPAPPELPIGASRFGGLPDLPGGVAWPIYTAVSADGTVSTRSAPIPLVAQIKLSEVAPFDHEHALPRSGWLWFFADPFGLDELYGYDATWEGPPHARVLFEPDESVTLERRPRPEGMHEDRPWRARTLRFRAEQTLPHYETTWIGERTKADGFVPMNEDEWSLYAGARRELIQCGWRHRLLGYSDDVQPYILENGYYRARPFLFPELRPVDPPQADLHDEYRLGRLLLQVESQDDMGFGRWGCGAFYIREEDLRCGRFDRVWFNEA